MQNRTPSNEVSENHIIANLSKINLSNLFIISKDTGFTILKIVIFSEN